MCGACANCLKPLKSHQGNKTIYTYSVLGYTEATIGRRPHQNALDLILLYIGMDGCRFLIMARTSPRSSHTRPLRVRYNLFFREHRKRQMRDIQPIGRYADSVIAPSPFDWQRTIKLGVLSETFQQYAGHGIGTVIAQYYGIVQKGLLVAQHAFKGLNRKLLDDEDVQAEEKIIIYSWRPLADYLWSGSRSDGNPIRVVPPPPARVFVVLARIDTADQHGVEGSIERWNWIREDPKLPKAPVDWQERYGTKLWSR
jgi:hypothetical protein